MSTDNVDINDVLEQLRASGSMPEELVEIFGEEAEEHIRNIYDGLDRMRIEFSDLEALADIRRSTHTLKGAAAAVGLVPVTRLSHRMEDLLDYLFDHKIGATEELVDLFLNTTDQLQDLTTGEFDFDDVAKNMLELYQQYESQMNALTNPDSASDENEPTAEQEKSADASDNAEESSETLEPSISLELSLIHI